MAYEILNLAQITPQRLYALTRLVARLEGESRKSILDLLQPAALTTDQTASSNVLLAAQNSGLVTRDDDNHLVLAVDAAEVKDMDTFRTYMQGKVLGVTDETHNNYLFNSYAAWYATQNELVFSMPANDFYVRFNAEMHAGADERAFNGDKFIGWRTWAAFLGLGWALQFGNRRQTLVPDARSRVEAQLPKLLPETDDVQCSVFMERLARSCPELDGGELFERAWGAAQRPARGNRLSLMLSSALRGLHEQGKLTLLPPGDARETWQLFPAAGYTPNQIGYVRRGASA